MLDISEIPTAIIKHLSLVSNLEINVEELLRYDNTNSRQRHMNNIRKYLNISPYNEKGKEIITTVVNEAAKVKDDVCDFINIAVEGIGKT